MKLNIARSIKINKSPNDIYSIVADLSQWNFWSPWIHLEPSAKTLLTGLPHEVGQAQTWEGEVIGSGKMTLQQLTPNKTIDIKLEFLKPWKSLATVSFYLEKTNTNETLVTWKMESSLPFFMFFFKNQMIAFMSSDFDRGLRMLKEFAETGTVLSLSRYLGIKDIKGFQIVAKRSSCTIVDLSKNMSSDFQQMMELMNKNELNKPQIALSLTHKFDMVKGICEYSTAYQYKTNESVKIPPNYYRLEVKDHKAIAVEHLGAYRHLGNPWGMAMSYLRAKKYKARKDVTMYETYITMPQNTAEKDTITQIFIPIK